MRHYSYSVRVNNHGRHVLRDINYWYQLVVKECGWLNLITISAVSDGYHVSFEFDTEFQNLRYVNVKFASVRVLCDVIDRSRNLKGINIRYNGELYSTDELRRIVD